MLFRSGGSCGAWVTVGLFGSVGVMAASGDGSFRYYISREEIFAGEFREESGNRAAGGAVFLPAGK